MGQSPFILGVTADEAMALTSFPAVPEPATYAALLGAAALGFVILRRRRLAA